MLCKLLYECSDNELVEWGNKTSWQSTDPAKYLGNLKHAGNPTENKRGKG